MKHHRGPLSFLAMCSLALLALPFACDSDEETTPSSGTGGDTTSSNGGGTGGVISGGSGGLGGSNSSSSSSSGSSSSSSSSSSSGGTCPAGILGQSLGRQHLLIGGSMDDTSFAAAPFDIRYRYLAGDVPETGPCNSCVTNCSVNGVSCAANQCEWWGCWQYVMDPPGRYVANHILDTAADGAIPMITYYIWYSVAGNVEGAPEIAALSNQSEVDAYLADFRFLCDVIAENPSIPVILHIEPDLWGYGHQQNSNPAGIPVAVSAAADPACSGQPDNLAGFAQCMVAIANQASPNALVGFHASSWGAGADALINSDPNFNLVGHAQQTASFMQALGAGAGDLIVVEMSDRDAGFDNDWWDATDASLPSFTQAINWVDALGAAMNQAPLFWQVPYGHMGLTNVCDGYQDNRVDYVFDHPERFTAGGVLGVAFGSGASCMTTPATDGGHFTSRASSYFQGNRPYLCQ